MTRWIAIICVVFCSLVIASFWIFHYFGRMGTNLHFIFLFGLILLAAGLLYWRSRVEGHVLRGAEVKIHSVKAVPPPLALRAGQLKNPGRYYAVDFSVTPVPSVRREPWSPEAFSLIMPYASTPEDLDSDEAGEAVPDDVQVWNGTEFCPGKLGKLFGPQRLRLTFCVESEAQSASLEYSSEKLAKLDLPKGA